MNQIERISKMGALLKSAEAACDELDSAIERLAEALAQYDKEQENFDILTEYYEGDEWMRDFEDDEAGLIPQSIDRGALTEDSIYDLLLRRKDLDEILQALRSYL